jgi:hypothetical protein
MNILRIVCLFLGLLQLAQAKAPSLADWRSYFAKEQNSLNQKLPLTTLQVFVRSSGFLSSLIGRIEEDLAKTGGMKGEDYHLFRMGLQHYLSSAVEIEKLNTASFANNDERLTALARLLEETKRLHDNINFNKTLRTIVRDLSLPQLESLFSKILNKKFAQLLEENANPVFEAKDDSFTLFKETLAFNLLKEGKDLSELAQRKVFWIKKSDGMSNAAGSILRAGSRGFSAVASPIAWRDNGFVRSNGEHFEKLKKSLRPLDLIFEKKRYKLTDYTIPGHFGHVGVWLGTEDDLRELGLWDHPSLAPFREEIRAGRSIFEVRITGLVFNSLENWVNLDEMAVIRAKNVFDGGVANSAMAYEGLYNQMGKTYDFAFNAMTSSVLTCTELGFQALGHVRWPLKKMLGNYTITPDSMAELAFAANSPVEFVMYLYGDENGVQLKDANYFARALGLTPKDGIYTRKDVNCRYRRERFNRSAIRFQSQCKTSYIPLVYSE